MLNNYNRQTCCLSFATQEGDSTTRIGMMLPGKCQYNGKIAGIIDYCVAFMNKHVRIWNKCLSNLGVNAIQISKLESQYFVKTTLYKKIKSSSYDTIWPFVFFMIFCEQFRRLIPCAQNIDMPVFIRITNAGTATQLLAFIHGKLFVTLTSSLN